VLRYFLLFLLFKVLVKEFGLMGAHFTKAADTFFVDLVFCARLLISSEDG
jgi:hypothetical protein